ncbi:alpha-2-macroglobulin [bacterium]
MLKKIFNLIIISTVLVALFLCPACKRSPKPIKIKENNALWQKYISGHTSGVVSRKSKIQIEFLTDVFTKEMIGQNASNFVDISPKIDGVVSISSTREIVILPKSDLKQGRHYRVRIKGAKLETIPENIGDFEFIFKVIQQDIELNIEGLIPSNVEEKFMNLKGNVFTSDIEDSDKIESVFSAKMGSQKLKIKWDHDMSGKSHLFTITGIKRQEKTEVLRINVDSTKIGVNEKQKYDIDVPAIDIFKITDIRAVQGEQQFIAVYFSDKLKVQDLKGFVRINQKGCSSRIENNIIKVYPKKRFIGKVTIMIEPGIKNINDTVLKEQKKQDVFFVSQKPQVRFMGKGVILPDNKFLSIPFETINVHSVQVTAFKIYENNIAQFLQSNKLDGANDLGRVGRFLWRKTVHLEAIQSDKWQQHNLDVTNLLNEKERGIIRLTISINRGNSNWSGSEEDMLIPVKKEKHYKNYGDLDVTEISQWDSYEQSQTNLDWSDRNDPAKDAYYFYGTGVKDTRNFFASNIGLLAKQGQDGSFLVSATNLRTSDPLSGVNIKVFNFQNQEIGTGSTDASGFVTIDLNSTAFYLIARKVDDVGYLKLNQKTALVTSHFDVGGENVKKGVKGVIYGERGVWRPGDELHLVFVLEDKKGIIPTDHPVTMRLYNPKGQLMYTMTGSEQVNGFYRFSIKTNENDITGNWSAKAQLGDRIFTKNLKIETIKPNRLKIELTFPEETLYKSKMPVKSKLFSQWLHGAKASNLKTDVELKLVPIETKFKRFNDYNFDDPLTEYKGRYQKIMEGELDSNGYEEFKTSISSDIKAPGKMMANFRIKVYEAAGAYSVSYVSYPYHPYSNYVGIKLPKGDEARGMLLTDKKHKVSIVSVNSEGELVSLDKVKISLYKIDWKWWWDKSEESLARYLNSSYYKPLKTDVISTKNGLGEWEFEIKYPNWGRYFVRVVNDFVEHSTGQIFYIDWPGWAGRAQEESGAGANVLTFFSDKKEYEVGEKAIIQLPEASQGRALVAIENGARILQKDWIVFDKGKTKFELPITKDMTPNIYVSVALIQPHQDKNNDRPIRLFGVIPIHVKDSATVLKPVIKASDEWSPETKVSFEVSESNGRSMTYTVAIVDEGLLGLTNYKTTNLHNYFYKKEALGIKTWDMYDYVVGAYGADIERLLSIGGDGDLDIEGGKEETRRFPPVVKFMGPFTLDSKKTNKHEIKLPQYVGAVRIMVVAGFKGAYGKTEKSVFVKDAMTILPTLPRVMSPNEEIIIPVTIFTNEKSIKTVKLKLDYNNMFQVVGNNTVDIRFAKPGEKIHFFNIKVSSSIGKAKFVISGQSGSINAVAETYVDVRSPNPETVRQYYKQIDSNAVWKERIVPHGMLGTNRVLLEVSSLPPLNLEKRLGYLIRYPHGCVEQVTSSVFPQLYLSNLVKLNDMQKTEIENNVNAGIERLRQFQINNGGFVYWPGSYTSGDANAWVTNYAGHFLIEAQKMGYFVQPEMLSDWTAYQKARAQSWNSNLNKNYLEQSYRLFTLALFGKAELGAMNRFREIKSLPNECIWQLAAAYKLAGLSGASEELVRKADFSVKKYSNPGATFGSSLRNKAIILNSIAILKQHVKNKSENKLNDLIDEISNELISEKWLSTQSIAYALMALSEYYIAEDVEALTEFTYTVGNFAPVKIESKHPIFKTSIENYPFSGDVLEIINNSNKKLFAAVTTRGIPLQGDEMSFSNGLSINVDYVDSDGNKIDITQMEQGMDIEAKLVVKNTSNIKLENIALTHIAASGWEIFNPRLDSIGSSKNSRLDYQDFRDDRVYSYFSLKPDEQIDINTRFISSYLGNYYLPAISVEAMYDAGKNARLKGKWIKITESKK